MRKLLLALLIAAGSPFGAHAAMDCTIKSTESAEPNQSQELLEACTKALKANPRDSEARYVRGSLLAGMGRDAEAIEDLSYSILLAPKFADSYYNRSAAYLAMGEWRKAHDDATRAVELDPKNGGAYHNRAIAKEAMDDAAGAIDDFTRAIELGYSQNFGSTYQFRADALTMAERWEEAVADYSRALEDLRRLDLAERIPPMQNGRAWALYKIGRGGEGLADIQGAIEAEPGNAEYVDTRAHIFEALGRTDEAIRDYRRALELDPELPESLEGLGRLTE